MCIFIIQERALKIMSKTSSQNPVQVIYIVRLDRHQTIFSFILTVFAKSVKIFLGKYALQAVCHKKYKKAACYRRLFVLSNDHIIYWQLYAASSTDKLELCVTQLKDEMSVGSPDETFAHGSET